MADSGDETQPVDNSDEDANIMGVLDEEFQANNNTSLASSGKRKFILMSRKLEAVEYAKKTTNRKAATKYNVDRKCIRDWRRKEKLLRQRASENKNAKRLPGAGKKVHDRKFDEALATWVHSERQKKVKISRRILKNKANSLRNDSSFKASNGWMECFLKRHNFVNRKVTSVCQKLPEEYASVIAKYLFYVSELRKDKNYQYMYASDETGVVIEGSDGITVSQKGVTEVSVNGTGSEKFRITVMLTARHDGVKLKPFVLLQRKRPDPKIVQKFSGKLELHWCGYSWMDNKSTSVYLEKIFGRNLFGVSRCLFWDKFSAHQSQETQDKLAEIGMDSITIPPGCTKYLQPPDTDWNRPFKTIIRQKFEDWCVNETKPKPQTKSGKPKGPPMEEYLQWIVEAWDHLTQDLICKSFFHCGITTNIDGSQDKEVLCIRKEIPKVLELLKELRSSGVQKITDDIDDLAIADEQEQEDIEECTSEASLISLVSIRSLPFA